ncbi:MAG TPA: hypothetical protein VIL49_00710 [Capillimicrobium sp.]
MKPQLRLLALLAALVAAMTLAACGGGDDDDSAETSDRSASEILQETFKGGDGVESGVLTLGLDVAMPEGSGTGQSAQLELSGPFESAESDDGLPRFDFTLKIAGDGAMSIEAGAVSTGDAGFLTFQGEAYEVPADVFAQFRDGFVEAQKQGDDADQPTLQALGIDPSSWVVDPQKAGTEEVGGVATEHITAGVDVPKLLDDIQKANEQAGDVAGQQGLSADDVAAFEEQVESAEIEVWTGAEDLRLRRMVVDVALKGGGTVGLTLEIADLDQPQDIAAPSDPRPIDELMQQLQGLVGGAGAPAPADPSADPAAGGAIDPRYLECMTKAGEDLEQQQGCVKFL